MAGLSLYPLVETRALWGGVLSPHAEGRAPAPCRPASQMEAVGAVVVAGAEAVPVIPALRLRQAKQACSVPACWAY